MGQHGSLTKATLYVPLRWFQLCAPWRLSTFSLQSKSSSTLSKHQSMYALWGPKKRWGWLPDSKCSCAANLPAAWQIISNYQIISPPTKSCHYWPCRYVLGRAWEEACNRLEWWGESLDVRWWPSGVNAAIPQIAYVRPGMGSLVRKLHTLPIEPLASTQLCTRPCCVWERWASFGFGITQRLEGSRRVALWSNSWFDPWLDVVGCCAGWSLRFGPCFIVSNLETIAGSISGDALHCKHHYSPSCLREEPRNTRTW